MCGRFILVSNPEAVAALFGYAERPNFPPRFNVAPGQPVGVVRAENGAARFALLRWGLLPAWAKDARAFRPLVNLRSEGVAERGGFRAAFERRRCLVPADGWYEWQATGGKKKRPFLVRPADGGLLALAGIWEHHLAPDGSEIETLAVLTTDASAALGGIHHRMPAVIRPEDFALWLDPASDVALAAALLRPAPDAAFVAHEVSPRVGAVANDDEGLIAPLGPADNSDAEREPLLL
jgi:putative SOS response-associated peptidase YedK